MTEYMTFEGLDIFFLASLTVVTSYFFSKNTLKAARKGNWHLHGYKLKHTIQIIGKSKRFIQSYSSGISPSLPEAALAKNLCNLIRAS